mgnify:CR=1 FL=1
MPVSRSCIEFMLRALAGLAVRPILYCPMQLTSQEAA